MKHIYKIAALAALVGSTQVQAVPLSFWNTDGWTGFVSEDQTTNYLNPGWGGQYFDAEYLYYKVSGNTLHLGLQTGFDVAGDYHPTTNPNAGSQVYSGKRYYSGDLALSFGDTASYTWNYGVDFGFDTKDINHTRINMGGPGADIAGLYSNTTYAGDLSFQASDPFAIDSGSFAGMITQNSGSGFNADGYGGNNTSYWRTVSFDATGLDLSNVDVHWTMSCGNDEIQGSFSVPEPSMLSLLGFSLLSLGFIRRRKSKA